MSSLAKQRLDLLLQYQEVKSRYDAQEKAKIAANWERWRNNPSEWVQERLSEHVWSKQHEIMESLRDNRRTAVQSCHGVGKSHIASRAVAWWLDTSPTGEAFVVTTAPTGHQVRAVLWRYIGQVHSKAKLPGRVTQVPDWKIDGELVAYGRKPADHDPGAFQGIHANRVLVVLDEACGIPEQLWYAIDSLTTNEDCRVLAIGNPDDSSSYFARVCRPDSLWHTIGISAFDSPNFTGEPVPESVAHNLISRQWVDEKRIEWGEDNPIYKAKVLGEFSVDNQWATVRASDVYQCGLGIETVWSKDQLLPVELGVDVGGGGDETVIRERRGPLACREWKEHTDKPHLIAPLILQAIRETGATRVKIDSIGVGFGVCGELENLRKQGLHSAEIVQVNVAEKSRWPEKYANVRAEMWWEIGRLLSERREWDLSARRYNDVPGMSNAEVTLAQLLDPKWELTPKGQILIEKKDEIRKRLGRSPDNADALLMAFYTPPSVGSLNEWFSQGSSAGPSWAGLSFGRAA
ncbi:MAG TPA: hypothetical protein VFT53_07620 [Candidatus Saccharimonadales bacterium]|nr:hypothetical protein [Candidatus Saccharimonadales bacterium]